MGQEWRARRDDPDSHDERRLADRAKPATIVLSLLVVLGAIAYMYVAKDHPDPPPPDSIEMTFESPEVQEARADEPEGLAQLQRLVSSPDARTAKQAVTKLSMSGRAGWLALFAQLPEASAEVKAFTQDTMLGPGRVVHAASAIESGSSMAREGAYIALQTDTTDVFNPEDATAHQQAEVAVYWALLTRVETTDEAEAEAVFRLMKRYHPNTPYAIGLMIEHESPIVRAAGVRSYMYSGGPKSVERVKRLGSDPDPRVRKEAAEVLKNYPERRTNYPPGMEPPPVAGEKPHN